MGALPLPLPLALALGSNSLRSVFRCVAATLGGVLVVALFGAAGVAHWLGPASALAWQIPVEGPLTQGFGCTELALEPYEPHCPPASPFFHSGVDLAPLAGTEVRAAAPGRVHIRRTVGGYGLHVMIDHAGDTQSLYGHLSAVEVEAEAWVNAGEVIGRVGSSGNSTGPHLHFEIRAQGLPVDPRVLLPALAGGG
jgi:murein DD-endopeptidase MepM/ murein hydrolase activator NlpD